MTLVRKCAGGDAETMRSLHEQPTPNEDMTRVILATDRPELGHALSLFLTERRIDVVDVVDDAGRLRAQAEIAHPDAVLVDWHLGACASSQMVADLQGCADHPTPVIILSTTRDRPSAHNSGAAAYATLGDHPDSLLAALAQVCSRP